MNIHKNYKKYKRLTQEQVASIGRMYEENIGQRAIARFLKIYIRAVQYHIEKLKKYKQMYKDIINSIKSRTTFVYLIIDELYTFIRKKDNKAYIWSAIAVDTEGKQYYFYHLSRKKDNNALIAFQKTLPEINKVYCDGNMSYSSIFGEKATMQKSVVTNLIESLNSSLRSKISYLTRKSDKHSKNFEFLDYKLANYFYRKNSI